MDACSEGESFAGSELAGSDFIRINVEIAGSRISVCVRDLCAAPGVHLGETLSFSWMAFGCTGSMH